MVADVKLLARLLGVPYFPITPLFPLAGPAGLLPLPSKWHIAFGEPIPTADYGVGAADDPMVTFEVTDQVRENIQQTLYRLLAGRRNVFLG
jgi:1-acyl-sn-glycerol-3-phosphate acyltransferase